jgi:hypothetical protein
VKGREHVVVGKETLKFGSIFGSLPDFPSLSPLSQKRENVAVEILSWGDLREKKRKQIENDDEKQKKKQEYEKNHPDRKFSSK